MPATAVNGTTDIPLVNWTEPQFLDGTSGVTTTMSTARVGGSASGLKTERSLSVFTPIQPCRLVDTRNLFSPAIVSPGPFSAGEIRSYTAAGLCGLPAASKGLRALSIAITTLPSSASGDVETVPHGTPLGGTVDMVVQANQWNSVSKIVRVDATGTFDMQLRITSGDVAIDVNGYYIDTSTSPANDFYSVKGTYTVDPGGLFYSENTSAASAAIRAFNSGGVGSDVLLASGANAIDIASGQIRVRNAGIGTSTPAFIHQVTAANLCSDSRYTRLDESHVSSPNSSAGQILFVQEAEHTGAVNESIPKLIRTVFLSTTPSFTCGGITPVANSWFLFSTGAFATTETYNILLINP